MGEGLHHAHRGPTLPVRGQEGVTPLRAQERETHPPNLTVLALKRGLLWES